MSNYYQTLGVDENATQEEIKKAYRALSMKWHPDRNKSSNAADMFKSINEAHETLIDKNKRSQYDMNLRGFPPGFGININGANMAGFEVHNMDEVFANIFGGFNNMQDENMPPEMHMFTGGFPGGLAGGLAGGFFQALQKPQPIIKNLYLSMEEVYIGGTFPIEIDPWCIINNNKIVEKKKIDVIVPPGIKDNEYIIMKGIGNQISSRQIGDVKILVNTKDHHEFTRYGLDLIYKKTISLKQALCGFEFDIEHLSKRIINFKNSGENAIIYEGYKKIIPQLGFKHQNHTGNLIIEFSVKFPECLSEKQKNQINDIL